MQKPNSTKQRFRIFIFATLLISIISISGLAVYAMQSVSIPLEIKEPLEILDYPTSFSLYSGETTTFEFTVKNKASVTIFQEFDFTLNDTNYQNSYVTFSNHNYSIPTGTNKLQAWLTISPNAPQANLIITINKKTNTPSPTPIPTATPTSNTNITLTPTLELLAGGASWASQGRKNALYINDLDNWKIHCTTDGFNWQTWNTETMSNYRSSIIIALESSGFEVTTAGDLPEDISNYDLVVFFAYYAVEPRHEPLIKDYIYNGGNVVFIAATQNYLTSYSKSLSCNSNLEQIQEWFGASTFLNRGGSTRTAFDNPFGTSLTTDENLITCSPSASAITSLSSSANVIAVYDSGEVFAFTNEYGAGRVYYQVAFVIL